MFGRGVVEKGGVMVEGAYCIGEGGGVKGNK